MTTARGYLILLWVMLVMVASGIGFFVPWRGDLRARVPLAVESAEQAGKAQREKSHGTKENAKEAKKNNSQGKKKTQSFWVELKKWRRGYIKNNKQKIVFWRKHLCPQRRLHGRLRQRIAQKSKNLSPEIYFAARYGREGDYWHEHWERCHKGLAQLLRHPLPHSIEKDILEIFVDIAPEKILFVVNQKMRKDKKPNDKKKSESRGNLYSDHLTLNKLYILAWRYGRRQRFAEKIQRNPRLLIGMDYAGFIKRNGRSYPTAIHYLGYKAVRPLRFALASEDPELKRYALHALRYLKTRYNRSRVLRTLVYHHKREKNETIKQLFKELIRHYRRR